MSGIYKTYDYSNISIENIVDIDLDNLSEIANYSIGELCSKKFPHLLVFPNELNLYKDGIENSYICTLDHHHLRTGDLLGFVGINNCQLTISSRFAKDDKADYFLHYMVQKVFSINLFDLKHSTSKDSVFDFLAYMFPFYLKRALRQGLYKEYATRNYNDANVRGTISISKHIKYDTPFGGKIAYKVKEYTFDNDLTQLIRHTIEHLRTSYMSAVLKTDADTEAYVSQICNVTAYNKEKLHHILAKNLKHVAHPYYTEYSALQKLCVQILQHKKLKYGVENNQIYGLLFSGSWLWEEFLYKTVLSKCGFSHPQNKAGKGGVYLFEKSATDTGVIRSRHKRYPDYFKDGFILDAKYKHLENNCIDRNDMHQIISYMYVEKADLGGFIYPYDKPSIPNVSVTKLGNLRGYGGIIYNIGVAIPQQQESYKMFIEEMNKIQTELEQKISEL